MTRATKNLVRDSYVPPPTQRKAHADDRVESMLAEVEVLTVSPQQETAIVALIAGNRQQEAAQAAGVTPETVSRWLANDPRFVALLNARRRELWEVQRDKLRGLVDEAIRTVEDCMSHAQPAIRLRAAMLVLQAANVLDGASPAALPDTENGVQKQWFEQRARDQISAIDLLAAGLM